MIAFCTPALLASWIISCASVTPRSPVHALAHPALMATPCTAAECSATMRRLTTTGAAQKWLRVNTPAAAHGLAERIRQKSDTPAAAEAEAEAEAGAVARCEAHHITRDAAHSPFLLCCVVLTLLLDAAPHSCRLEAEGGHSDVGWRRRRRTHCSSHGRLPDRAVSHSLHRSSRDCPHGGGRGEVRRGGGSEKRASSGFRLET